MSMKRVLGRASPTVSASPAPRSAIWDRRARWAFAPMFASPSSIHTNALNSAMTDARTEPPLGSSTEGIQTPLQRLEHNSHPLVAYLIVPLFALANAGVPIGGTVATAIGSPIAYGVFLGLLVGKQLGILGVAYGVVRLGWAELPSGVTWRHMWGAGWVAGIGFTMSLFIGELAFVDGHGLLDVVKVAILAASVVAATSGWFVLRGASRVGVSSDNEAPHGYQRAEEGRGRPGLPEPRPRR